MALGAPVHGPIRFHKLRSPRLNGCTWKDPTCDDYQFFSLTDLLEIAKEEGIRIIFWQCNYKKDSQVTDPQYSDISIGEYASL